MCFSYAINFSAKDLQTKLQLGDDSLEIQLPWETPTSAAPLSSDQPILPEPGYFLSGFTHPTLPVLTATSNNHINLCAMQWGLIPHWCKSQAQAQELGIYGLNARAETLTEKPLFRDAWKSHPCLLPVSGFFEWQAIGKKKQPYYIYASDAQPLLFAGLFAEWTDTDTGEQKRSYAIITTEANALMAEIHNVKKRMPVILDADQAKRYLQGDATVRETFLKPCDNAILTAHPVAPWLNQVKVNRNVPQALLPIEKDFPQTLF